MRENGIQHRDCESALTALASSINGLTPDEAARRLREFGPNRIASPAPRPAVLLLAAHFTHFFALVLWLAAALALIAHQLQPGERMDVLGGAILAVILINGLFSFAQEHRAGRALDALQEILPASVTVYRGGAITRLPVSAIVPGDLLLLAGGDLVPADCRLLEAFGVRVNTATITGESLPRSRSAAPSAEENLLDAGNILLAGTSLVAGEARAVVFATGAHTEFGRIAVLTRDTPKLASPLEKEINRLSRWIGGIAAVLGLIFFALGMAGGIGFWGSFVFAIGIIVANVPEGLLPTVTLALAMGAQRMAARNALIRHLPSVETLGAVTVICTDKTGTLTENRLRVAAVWVDGGVLPPDSSSPAMPVLFTIAAHCHSLVGSGSGKAGELHGDPLELALAEWADAHRKMDSGWQRVDELPFDSDRRRMSTLHASGDGFVILSKGALEAVLPRCSHLSQNGEEIVLDAQARERVTSAEAALALQGHRVLALARREVGSRRISEHDETDMLLCGLIALEDPVRQEVPAAVLACRRAGVRVVMVTGDHPRTAQAVASETGLFSAGSEGRVIDGARLALMPEAELHLTLDAPELVFARISAEQKRRIVSAFKRRGDVVAVTGDGVNDAPALREAHIGIAMGRSGTDVAKAAADMVLLDDNFASIVAAIEEGRAVFDNIRKFLVYILSSNVPEAVPYLASVLAGIPLPLTILQILAVDLGTDMLPALALGSEPPAPDVMQRKPRPRNSGLIDRGLLARAFLWLGAFEAIGGMSAYFAVMLAGGWVYGESLAPESLLYRQATSACFSAIVLMQVVNVWMCRSERIPALARGGPPVSRLFMAGLLFELLCLLLIVWTPAGNRLFATAPVPISGLWAVIPCALALLFAEEARKRIVHHRAPGPSP